MTSRYPVAPSFDIASELKRRNAKRGYACLSHILLNEEGLRRLEASDIELIISTDSIDNPVVSQSEKIQIVSVAPVFAEAVRRIHSRSSVSTLFDRVPDRVLRFTGFVPPGTGG